MSKLGNIYLSYGKQFNFAIANTYSNVILTGNNLPVNTIIISSPVDDDNNDIGSYSIIVTDSEGSPVRLSYCIKSANGLNVDGDTLYLSIDNSTIKNSDSGLKLDLSFIDDAIINVSENKLSIKSQGINYATKDDRGIVSVDGKSVKVDNDTLYINTDSLLYADNSSKTYGILTSSDDKINIDNGIISLNQDRLTKADKDTFGLAKMDEYTLNMEYDNTISVNTKNLEQATVNDPGMIKVDGSKVTSNGGELSINTGNLRHATHTTTGIVAIDGNSIVLDSENRIGVKDYNILMNNLKNVNTEITNIEKSLSKLKDDIQMMVN